MKSRKVPLLKIFICFFVFNFLSFSVFASEVISPLWNLNDINSQIRSLTTDYSGTSAIIGGASKNGNASNNTLIIDGLNVSTEDDPQTAYDNGTDILAGGIVYNHEANNNTVQILNGSTIQGRDVIGGGGLLEYWENRTNSAYVSGNSVLIKDSSIIKSSLPVNHYEYDPITHSYVLVSDYIGGNVYGGVAGYYHGKNDKNSITIDNSTVEGGIIASYAKAQTISGTDFDEHGNLNEGFFPDIFTGNSTIKILNGSVVNGAVIGGFGSAAMNGNNIEIDASTVNEVFAAMPDVTVYSTDNTSNTTARDNTIIIRNGSTINNVFVAGGASVNSINNKLIIDNSTINNGYFYSAFVLLDLRQNGTIPINAEVSSNSIAINNMSSFTANEIAGALNLSGKANNNNVSLTNLSGLTISRPALTFGVLNIPNLETKNLLSLKDPNGVIIPTDDSNSSYGFIYGGTALDYTSQTNTMPDPVGGVLPAGAADIPGTQIIANGGNQADGNRVSISNSTVNANIIGGFSGEIREVDYTNWSEESGDYIKQQTVKIGNEVVVYRSVCDGNGQNCSTPTDISHTPYTNVPSSQFSASNNTVILDNVNFDGTVYGGYVIGADLKDDNVKTSNNTVVIRGNTNLSATSLIFGGNGYLGMSSNNLVFDHVAGAGGTYITYNNANQFQNFNDTWQVNADLDTRIDFQMNNVDAIVNIDNPQNQEGTATIIKTQTSSDLTDVEQNGVIVDLGDTSIELSQKKKGIYSYDLVATKEDPTTVGWVLSIARDQNNVEIYGQLPLVGLALASEGSDILNNALREAWQSDLNSGSFVDGGYHHTRYHTGSGFDLNSGIIQSGFWKKLNSDWLAGLFVKYANGSYETYPIKATGSANAFGGGLMTSYRYSQTGYIEANAEVGYLDMEFKSSEMLADMKSRGIYYGGLFGVVEQITPYWNLFTNLQYLRKDKDSMTDNLGQKVSYDAMQSLAFRAGTDVRLTKLTFEDIVPSIGVSCIYEFDGKSKVDVSGTTNNEASMRGFSARGEIGFSYNSEEGYFPLISKLTLFGQGGKRSGFGGELNLSFKF